VFYSCLNPELYPAHLGPPAYFIQLPSTSKSDLWCKGGPMAVARAPPSSPICCVLIIYSFLCLYPPAPGQPLLSGSTTTQVVLVHSRCKKVAVTEGLDPARLLPHSLRVGSVNAPDRVPWATRTPATRAAEHRRRFVCLHACCIGSRAACFP
jgi:hypothetical protein